MTTRELIVKLLDMPLDATITIETDDGSETHIDDIRASNGGFHKYVYITPVDPVNIIPEAA